MPERTFPRPDADFAAYMAHYAEAVKAWFDAQGLDPAQYAPLVEAMSVWDAAYPAHVAARAAAHAARMEKDVARAALIAAARPLTQFIQTYPTTTDADRAAIGISVRPARGTPSPAPTSAPRVLVSAASRLTHELRLVDESTPTRRARPRNAQRAEVYVALTPPHAPAPTDPEAFRYIGSTSDGTTTLTFEQTKGGQQAHYMARWVSPRNASGPWSETASATVAA